MTPRLKMLYLLRLVPLAEANYDLIELGPCETGKSLGYQQLSPYAILLDWPSYSRKSLLQHGHKQNWSCRTV